MSRETYWRSRIAGVCVRGSDLENGEHAALSRTFTVVTCGLCDMGCVSGGFIDIWGEKCSVWIKLYCN